MKRNDSNSILYSTPVHLELCQLCCKGGMPYRRNTEIVVRKILNLVVVKQLGFTGIVMNRETALWRGDWLNFCSLANSIVFLISFSCFSVKLILNRLIIISELLIIVVVLVSYRN